MRGSERRSSSGARVHLRLQRVERFEHVRLDFDPLQQLDCRPSPREAEREPIHEPDGGTQGVELARGARGRARGTRLARPRAQQPRVVRARGRLDDNRLRR